MRTYTNQFPADFAVPPQIIALNLRDTSWGNDTSPSFALSEDDSVRLFVDHPDPDQREMGGRRFSIIGKNDLHKVDDLLFSTDNVGEIVAYIKDYIPER